MAALGSGIISCTALDKTRGVRPPPPLPPTLNYEVYLRGISREAISSNYFINMKLKRFSIIVISHLVGKELPYKRCMIKLFRGGRGGDTFKTPSHPVNNFCLYPPRVLRCFWKDPLMTPHHPTSSIFHCYPLPIHHPFPPLKILIIHKLFQQCHSGFIIHCKM